MVAAKNSQPGSDHESAHELYLKAYRFMLLARLAEEKLASLYRGGKIHGGVFIGKGQEALSVAGGLALRKGDVFGPLIRDQAGRLAFGEDLADTFRTYMGSVLGPMRGRDGNVHRGRPREGTLAMISHLGTTLSVVTGALFAKRMHGITDAAGLTSIGEGGTSTGSFHEGLNLAAVEKLPLVVVVANNQYAYSTPNSRQFACDDLVEKAAGYGVTGHSVDGTKLADCLEVVGGAVEKARAGGGPQLVVATLLRLSGHGEHDDANYISEKLKASPLSADCLLLAQKMILEKNWAANSDLISWREEAQDEIGKVVAATQREALPDPEKEDWCALANRHLSEGIYSA